MELLAPAGSLDALYAAVYEGANAVYLAGDCFGARAYAKNFDNDTLTKAIKYAHLHNVAVHVTVNTIVGDNELEKLKEYLKFLEIAGADAILVQDLGVAKIAGEVCPNIPLHASTQMTIHNLDGALALQELGFSRVVLSRELTLEEIQHIAKNTNLEIEIFMHGALCVCYSGACLMSSMIGGRSGNRGRCAQPCRLPYALVDDNNADMLKGKAGDYLLSPKDLYTAEMLRELIESGAASFKIEGRMKSPEYVATVVRVYRAAIDRALNGDYTVTDAEKNDLRQIFNRDFTTAYLKGDYPGKDFISDKRPNNRGLLVGRVLKIEKDIVELKLSHSVRQGDIIEFWVKVGGRIAVTLEKMFDATDNEIFAANAGDIVKFKINGKVSANDRAFKVRDVRLTELGTAAAKVKRIEIDGEVSAKIGEPLTVKFTDNLLNSGESKTDFIGEVAKKRPLTEDTLQNQLNRLGDTAFSLKNLSCDIKDEVMIPISEINDARRKAIVTLENNRVAAFNLPVRTTQNFVLQDNKKNIRSISESELIARVDSLKSAKAALDAGANGIIFGSETYNHRVIPSEEYEKAADYARKCGRGIYFSTPRIVKLNEEESFAKSLELFDKIKPDGIYLHNIGGIFRAKKHTDLPLYTDSSLITYNFKTLEFLKEYGLSGATLSEELTLEEIKNLAKKSPMPCEIIIHGRTELMISNYCVLGSYLGERGKKACSMPCLKGKYFLKDRMGEKFPVVTDEYCRMRILNAKIRSALPFMKELRKLPLRLRIDGRYDDANTLAKIVKAYKKAATLDEVAARKFEESIFNSKDITRGHFFRGVL